MDTDSDPNGGAENYFDPYALPDLDIDELLGSAGLNFDADLNLNDFSSAPHVNDFDLPLRDLNHTLLKEEIDLGFDIPLFSSSSSVTTAAQPSSKNVSPSYEIKSEHSSSASSSGSANADDDMEPFNVDEFLNFHSNESSNDYRMEEDNIRSQRNTPSPVGSCSSSGGSSSGGSSGSSTSGIVSDACSVASSAVVHQDVEIGYINSAAVPYTMDIDATSTCIPADFFAPISPNSSQQNTNTSIQQPAATVEQQQQTVLPLAVPLLPLQTPTQVAAILQPLPQVQLIPVKTIPIAAPLVNANTPSVCKQQPLVVKRNAVGTILKPESKLAIKCNTESVQTTTAAVRPASPKRPAITPPTNSKPRTVYVSSDDYKALMQKMKPTAAAGAKGSNSKYAAQVPKIVMKTASGKVINANANKIVQSADGMAKISKMGLSGPMLIKQQPARIATTARGLPAKAAVMTTKSVGHVSDMNRYRGIMDEKMYKKQQRMIKNRESASLSRKKKKEYMASLEKRIHNLEKENCTLKGENSSLRSQLIALAQTCQCKNGNISEFVLNSLNASPKGPSNAITNGNETRPIRILPKPETKSLKERQIRKNMVLLLAMAFMITFNAGSFSNFFKSNPIENAIEMSAEEPAAAGAAATAGGGVGRLLWVESEHEYKQKHNRTKREVVDMPQPPPLHFLHPINRTVKYETSNDAEHLNGTAREPPLLSSKFTSGFSNQTENMRLARDLHKWIDGNDYLNLSTTTNNDLENGAGFKLPTEYFKIKPTNLPLQRPGPAQKRKYYLASEDYETKQRKMANDNKNSLDFFKPSINEEYLRFFKNIKRQDDTFYVLSFNMDHLLLPASNYNKSARPKMSLMLPAGDLSVNGDIVLMQIDCEVINTTEVALKSHMVPEKLRPHKWHTHAAPNPNDVVNNETRAFNKPSGTVFLKKDDGEEILKVKPPVKTYFMFGPKTKAAAAAAAVAAGKKNITLTKVGTSKLSSGSVGSVEATQWKSLPLFAKIKETVEN